MTRMPPKFWYNDPQPPIWTRILLSALSQAYKTGHYVHYHLRKTQKAPIPVLCVGNIVAGGSGKTPTALALLHLIRTEKLAQNPCFLSRGYGGSLSGPLRVDPHLHRADQVGDEPLLLARHAPAYIAARRYEGAKLAQQNGHDFIIMDDGLQNPSLYKDFSLMVIDGSSGFGNGKTIPAGPLRSPIQSGLRQCDAVLIIGEDRHNLCPQIEKISPVPMPILHAAIQPVLPPRPASAYIAFCGIAHPSKFYRSLTEAGLNILATHDFPDHHPYSTAELQILADEARQKNARLITTEKDAVRLPVAFQKAENFDILPIELLWQDRTKDILCHLIKTGSVS